MKRARPNSEQIPTTIRTAEVVMMVRKLPLNEAGATLAQHYDYLHGQPFATAGRRVELIQDAVSQMIDARKNKRIMPTQLKARRETLLQALENSLKGTGNYDSEGNYVTTPRLLPNDVATAAVLIDNAIASHIKDAEEEMARQQEEQAREIAQAKIAKMQSHSKAITDRMNGAMKGTGGHSL